MAIECNMDFGLRIGLKIRINCKEVNALVHTGSERTLMTSAAAKYFGVDFRPTNVSLIPA